MNAVAIRPHHCGVHFGAVPIVLAYSRLCSRTEVPELETPSSQSIKLTDDNTLVVVRDVVLQQSPHSDSEQAGSVRTPFQVDHNLHSEWK